MRCWIAAVSFALLQAAVLQANDGDQAAALIARGEQIYHLGRLAGGELLHASVQGDVPVSGSQLTCVQCHRPSGFGSTESGRRIPPITAGALFSPRLITRRELYASREEGVGTRPAYTDTLLARAIRDGADPAGRALDASMPRFALADDEMNALIAYLKTLSAEPDPGVDERELHIATLIGPGVDPQHSAALLALMEAFISAKNSGTRVETRRAEHPPWQKTSSYPAYRKWVLHPWRLQGEPGDWPRQLQQLYADQPVFAVLGGVVEGDFQPIADFCNAKTLPCLFPTSDLPAAEPGFYTIHLHAGRTLEARTLAVHLHEEGLIDAGESLQQIYRRGDTAGADALRKALGTVAPLHDVMLSQPADRKFWQQLHATDVLVLWLGPDELAALASLPRPWPKRIYLQSTLEVERLHALPADLRNRIHLLYPYALPEATRTPRYRVKTWLQHKGLAFDVPRVQADSYFALTLFVDVMHQLKLNYSRAYAIEVIEHMLDSAVFSALYPRVSLAPGQRYASKGCYVVRLAETPEAGVVAASRWIVPLQQADDTDARP